MRSEFLDFIATADPRSSDFDAFLRETEFQGLRNYKLSDGLVCCRESPSVPYIQRIKRVADILQRDIIGSPLYGPLRFREAMNTNDFPLLFGDILDRQLLGNYIETPAVWMNFCRRGIVPDFRSVRRLAIDGAEGQLNLVGQQQVYPQRTVGETRYTYSVSKYGSTIGHSWEDIVNDDLGAFTDTPLRIAKAVRRSEQKFVTGLYVTTTGPHASLYTTANKNIINTTNGAAATNPALSIAGLQDGWTVLGNMVDSDGEPITIEAVELVVPPALEITAQNILNATQIWTRTTGGGTTAQEILAQNWMRGRVRISVDPYIPIVASSSNGATSWFLFASVASGGRPALEIGFLRGYEGPQLFRKLNNQVRLGGGGGEMDGDFDTDTNWWKVRHCFGGTRLDGKMTVASNGSGS